MEDIQIIQLLKEGNAYDRGMHELVKKYGGLVKYIITNILGVNNRQDIEECLSDVFCEFWQQVDLYDLEKGSLKNYLVGMARYMALNRYRKICKYQDRNILIDGEYEAVPDDLNMEKEILDALDNEKVKQEILNMPSPDKEIFIRRYFWFEKIKAIAETLNLESKQVENRIYKGKERLRKVLIKRGVDR